MKKLNLAVIFIVVMLDLAHADTGAHKAAEMLGVNTMLKSYERVILIEKPIVQRGQSACKDFYSYVCTENTSSESVVPLGSAKELKQMFLERFRLVLKNENHLSSSRELAQIYMDHFKIAQKLNRWRTVKNEVVSHAKILLSTQAVNPVEVDQVLKEISNVEFNDDYLNAPNRLVRLGVSIGRRIHVGGEVLLRMNSDAAIFFVIAHELGHTISSRFPNLFALEKQTLEKRFSNVKIFGFDNSERRELLELGFEPEDVMDASSEDRGVSVSPEEIWADHFATLLFARYVKATKQSVEAQKESLRDGLRFFCHYKGTRQGHPGGKFRIERLAEHPLVKNMLCAKQ